MPPSPSVLMISYWLIRTPGCGIALVACTAVETPSNESHADDGTCDDRFDRACSVLACGGAIAGVPGGVPFATVAGCLGSGADACRGMPSIVRCGFGSGASPDGMSCARTIVLA